MRPKTVTAQIEAIAFRLIEKNPEGIRWSELNTMIGEANPSFHLKTINGTVWKLTQKYPDRISKTDGLFRLMK